MTYPSILMFLDDDARAQVRDEQAVRFARRLGSHVEGLCCLRPVPVGVEAVAAMGTVVGPLAADLQAARSEAAAREQRFRSLCDSLQVASFETEVDDSDDAAGRAIVKRAALHDLVIVGQPDPAQAGAPRRRAAIDEVVLHSSRPTLLLPYAGRFDEFGKTALVAWDGSHGAARAAADALPLLRLAQTVHVVVFDTAGSPDMTGVALAQGVMRWLGRHGVPAVGQARYAGPDIGNALLSLAADLGADLLVMGCWGHGRLAERLLGGATRTVMASMTVPVLTSH